MPTRDEIAAEYFELLPFSPYPVQEEALLSYFTSHQGVLVCAPTGTGKTVIAEAAVYEALRTGARAYYTTPLIALTDQKLQELRNSAVRWGFSPDQIGLVTGNRRVNPEAPILVVVAEILLNRLLQPEAFAFDDVQSVVMDEFHSFNDPERGVVWELTLGMLPAQTRTLLLSATVGNSYEFTRWLERSCGRSLQLVESNERKIPLSYNWVDDHYLDEWIEKMAAGSETQRRTPALIFCFNRDECWQVGELLRGKQVLDKSKQTEIANELDRDDWSQGAGPKLKPLLLRGVGVHHAGILPKYRRIVEHLFQQKLLSVTVCTETLSAGINLPARSVVLPCLMKGPRDKRRLVETAVAQQIFGRAGRPQFDSEGFVYALAHEDDVKMLRWREKYDQIPEDTKDPGLLRAKKALKKKMPKRNENETYWNSAQFDKLRSGQAANLTSRGDFPWRLLAYLLLKNPQVQPLRDMVGRRLLDTHHLQRAQQQLNQMLVTLWKAGYVRLEPKPWEKSTSHDSPPAESTAASPGLLESAGLSRLLGSASLDASPSTAASNSGASSGRQSIERHSSGSEGIDLKSYRPEFAYPEDRLELLVRMRSINPLFGEFLAGHLAIADDAERLLALEATLDMPGTVARMVRVPKLDVLPPGPLATTRLDEKLLQLGLATQEELIGRPPAEEDESKRPRRGDGVFDEQPVWILSISEKLMRLFEFDFPKVHDIRISPVYVAGEVLEFGGNFNKYIVARGLQKHEGIVFRHLLRLILLMDEMASIPPVESTREDWEDRLDDIIGRLTDCCRAVDPESTDETLESGLGGDELTQRLEKRTRFSR